MLPFSQQRKIECVLIVVAMVVAMGQQSGIVVSALSKATSEDLPSTPAPAPVAVRTVTITETRNRLHIPFSSTADLTFPAPTTIAQARVLTQHDVFSQCLHSTTDMASLYGFVTNMNPQNAVTVEMTFGFSSSPTIPTAPPNAAEKKRFAFVATASALPPLGTVRLTIGDASSGETAVSAVLRLVCLAGDAVSETQILLHLSSQQPAAECLSSTISVVKPAPPPATGSSSFSLSFTAGIMNDPERVSAHAQQLEFYNFQESSEDVAYSILRKVLACESLLDQNGDCKGLVPVNSSTLTTKMALGISGMRSFSIHGADLQKIILSTEKSTTSADPPISTLTYRVLDDQGAALCRGTVSFAAVKATANQPQRLQKPRILSVDTVKSSDGTYVAIARKDNAVTIALGVPVFLLPPPQASKVSSSTPTNNATAGSDVKTSAPTTPVQATSNNDQNITDSSKTTAQKTTAPLAETKMPTTTAAAGTAKAKSLFHAAEADTAELSPNPALIGLTIRSLAAKGVAACSQICFGSIVAESLGARCATLDGGESMTVPATDEILSDIRLVAGTPGADDANTHRCLSLFALAFTEKGTNNDVLSDVQTLAFATVSVIPRDPSELPSLQSAVDTPNPPPTEKSETSSGNSGFLAFSVEQLVKVVAPPTMVASDSVATRFHKDVDNKIFDKLFSRGGGAAMVMSPSTASCQVSKDSFSQGTHIGHLLVAPIATHAGLCRVVLVSPYAQPMVLSWPAPLPATTTTPAPQTTTSTTTAEAPATTTKQTTKPPVEETAPKTTVAETTAEPTDPPETTEATKHAARAPPTKKGADATTTNVPESTSAATEEPQRPTSASKVPKTRSPVVYTDADTEAGSFDLILKAALVIVPVAAAIYFRADIIEMINKFRRRGAEEGYDVVSTSDGAGPNALGHPPAHGGGSDAHVVHIDRPPRHDAGPHSASGAASGADFDSDDGSHADNIPLRTIRKPSRLHSSQGSGQDASPPAPKIAQVHKPKFGARSNSSGPADNAEGAGSAATAAIASHTSTQLKPVAKLSLTARLKKDDDAPRPSATLSSRPGLGAKARGAVANSESSSNPAPAAVDPSAAASAKPATSATLPPTTQSGAAAGKASTGWESDDDLFE